MADALPPDPYAALGVARDADAAAIKSAYRKLALKYHPDKAKGKEAEFHKIQSAFEIIGEDESRRKYDDSYYLETTRQQRRGSRSAADVRTAAFDMRSSSKASATFTARGPARYEERRPKQSYDDDYRYFEPEENRASSRKSGGVGSTPRKPSSRSSKTTDDIRREVKDEKVSPKERAERKKQRDRDTVRERERKYSYVEEHFSDSDDATHERERERRRVYERSSPRSAYPEDESRVKYDMQTSDLKDYISRARAEAFAADPGASPPPPPQALPRSPSFMDPDVEVRRTSKEARPAFVKRSSTRSTKEKTPEPVRRSSAPHRRATSNEDVLEYEARRPQPPPLQTHLSSGSVPREARRSKTDAEYEAARPVKLSRSETMPAQRSATRRGDTTPVTSSNLRHSETHDSGYSTSSPHDTAPPPSFNKSYTFAAGDRIDLDDYQTAFREPSSRSRQRSPEELPRTHTSARGPTTTSSPRTTAYDEPDPVRTTPRAPRRPSADASPRIPGLQRGQTMPLPRTGRAGPGQNPDLLPYEIPRSVSPTEFTSPLRASPYRSTTEDIKWAPNYSTDDVKFADFRDLRDPVRRSSASAEAFSNRSSKDGPPREFTRRASTDYDRVHAARDYIAQAGRDAAFRPAMRKSPTTAY